MSGLPKKRDVLLALNVALLLLLVVSFVTGWIASWMSLTEFGVHKYSSVAFAAGAGAHLAMHWRALVSQARRFLAGAVELRTIPSRPVIAANLDLDKAS